MDLTPGEKAVLAQMGVLYREAPGDHSLRALTGQWPAAHYQTYNNAYAALIAKRLIEATDAQAIRLTEMGRRAIGIVSTTVSAEAPRKVQQPPRPRTHMRVVRPVRRTVMSRLVKTVFGWRDG